MRCEAHLNTGETVMQSLNYNVTVDGPPTLKMVAAKAQEVTCMTPEVSAMLRENDLSCDEYQTQMEESKQFYTNLYDAAAAAIAAAVACFISLGRILCCAFILPFIIGIITEFSIGIMMQGERVHQILSSASTLPQHKTNSKFTLSNMFHQILAYVGSTRFFKWQLNRLAMHLYNIERPRDDPVIRKIHIRFQWQEPTTVVARPRKS